HLRGSDKIVEDRDLRDANKQCMELLAAESQSKPIFLLSDDQQLVDTCTRAFGTRVIVTKCQRTGSQIGTHYLRDVDRKRLGEEIILDTYVAAEADTFIGNGRSNVAAMIALLKEWPLERCHLVNPSLLFERNLFLHQPAVP